MAHFEDEDEMQENARPGAHQHALHASTSEAVTNNLRVEVESQYAAEQSQPFHSHWFFHYTVRITNEGEETVQLISRHWIITDATATRRGQRVGRRRRTAGARAGESFQDTSAGPPRPQRD